MTLRERFGLSALPVLLHSVELAVAHWRCGNARQAMTLATLFSVILDEDCPCTPSERGMGLLCLALSHWLSGQLQRANDEMQQAHVLLSGEYDECTAPLILCDSLRTLLALNLCNFKVASDLLTSLLDRVQDDRKRRQNSTGEPLPLEYAACAAARAVLFIRKPINQCHLTR